MEHTIESFQRPIKNQYNAVSSKEMVAVVVEAEFKKEIAWSGLQVILPLGFQK